MLSSITQFPREEFINCIRNKGENIQLFVQQIKSLNTEWIYEAMKHLYNTLFQSKQSPDIKLEALKLCKILLDTCQIPCVTLFQVYFLPYIYEIAIYKPKQTGENRGHRFFIQNGYSQRIQKIEETGIEFVRLSTEILYVWSLVKKNRTLLSEELRQASQYTEYFNKFKKQVAGGFTLTSNQLRYYKQEDPAKLANKYQKKLNRFEPSSDKYCEFFVRKMVESLQSEPNILFAAANRTTSSLSNDLDMKLFLKYGDAYITSTLIQQIIDGLSSQNFIIKRNNLSLFSDLIKWGDIEAILQLNYDDFLQQIAQNIAQVNGQKGLSEGENIYPNIKGQKEAKKKFYIQFLKSIEIWSKLLQDGPTGDGESSKAEQFYQYFKIQRNFVFPQNLMLKRLEQDYQKCLSYNQQKNEKILAKIKASQSSALNTKKSASLHSQKANTNTNSHRKQEDQIPKKQKKILFQELQQNLDQMIKNFVTLCDEEDKIALKMNALIKFKDDFDNKLQNLDDQKQPNQDQLMNLIDDGDALITNIETIIPVYNNFSTKKISISQFKNQFQKKLQELEQNSYSRSKQEQNMKDINVLNGINNNLGGQTSENSITESVSHKQLQKINKKVDDHQVNIIGKIDIPKDIHLHMEQINKQSHSNMPDKFSQLQNSSIHSLNNKKKSQITSKVKSTKESQIHKQEKQPVKQQIILPQINNEYYNYNYNTPPQKQKISNPANQSIKDKISDHRSNRGDLSASQNRLNNSFSRINQSIRSIQSDRLKSSNKLKNSLKYKNQSPPNLNLQTKAQFILPENTQNLQVIAKDQKLETGKFFNDKPSKIYKIDKIDKIDKNIHPVIKQDSQISSISRRSASSLRASRSKNSKLLKNKQLKHSSSNLLKNQQKQVSQAYKMIQPSPKKQIIAIQKTQKQKPSKKYQPIQQQNRYYTQTSKINKLNKVQKNPKQQIKNVFTEQFVLPANDNYKIKPNLEAYEEDKGKKYIYGIQDMETKAKIINKNQNRFHNGDFMEPRPVTSKYLPQQYDRISSRKIKSSQLLPNLQYKTNQQYLMMKLKKQNPYGKERELQDMQDRIYRLRTESSKLRSQLSSRSNRNKEYSIGRRSSSNCSEHRQFHRSNSSSSQSSLRRKESIKSLSKNSITSLQGRFIHGNPYEMYFNNIQSDSIKKTLLKNKALLLKNSDIEIGYLFRKDKDILKIMLYLTPEKQINNLNYFILKQPNLLIKSYPEGFPLIPEKKQVKITVALEVRSFPFSLPRFNLQYYVNQSPEKKTVVLTLPAPIHRFLDFLPPNNFQEFENSFKVNERKIVQTSEFMVNRKICKLQLLKQYFPGLTFLQKNDSIVKYGATCKSPKQTFSLMMLARGSSYLSLQCIPYSKPEFVEFFMHSLKQIFEIIY